MANLTYMQNRWAYTRPQAIAWSKNYGVTSGGLVVPDGVEGVDFIILSEDSIIVSLLNFDPIFRGFFSILSFLL